MSTAWRVIASDVAEGAAGNGERLVLLYNSDRVQPSGLAGEILGDYNLDRIGDPLYEAFVATGLWPPTELNTVPRAIFDDSGANNFYDQIVWFSEPDGTPLLDGVAYNQRDGSFDFIPHVMTGLTKNEVSWRIWDHYPLWAEFQM